LTTGSVIVKVKNARVGVVVSELARISVRDGSVLSNRMGLLSVDNVADLTVMRNDKPVVIRASSLMAKNILP
jgi:hypothetical protein